MSPTPEAPDVGETKDDDDFASRDADLTTKIDDLEKEVFPPKPKAPPIGGMFG